MTNYFKENVLANYERFPIKTAISKKDKLFSDITSPNDCAQKCNEQLNNECKSFNYCPLTTMCYLSSSHLADGSASVTNDSPDLICNHFSSRNYRNSNYNILFLENKF